VQGHDYPYETATRRWAHTTGTPFVSLRQAFAELPRERWPLLYDGHWSPAGARAAAAAVARAIHDLEPR
jgi:hypothetical protein